MYHKFIFIKFFIFFYILILQNNFFYYKLNLWLKKLKKNIYKIILMYDIYKLFLYIE